MIARLVGDAYDEVCIHDIMNERHVLVADALDVVLSISIVEQRRTLQGLDHTDIRA